MSRDYSEAATIGAVLAFCLMWLAIPVALIVPFIVHIVVCVKANWAALLIVGLVFPPVGWVHGVGIIFGLWG
jgi:hypothetical protein